jgi:origin recognition complex subunit 2
MTRSTPRKRPVDAPAAVSDGDDRPGDRSVRKRVARRRIERALAESSSDDAASGDEVAAQAGLWDDDEDDDDSSSASSNDEEAAAVAAAATAVAGVDEPSAATTTPRRRGRPPNPNKPAKTPKRTKKDADEDALATLHLLPAHERYFWDNRPGARAQSSANTLPPGLLLDRDGYFATAAALRARHQEEGGRHVKERAFLLELHRRAFPQWTFEMDAGFGVLLYGYGSKRAVVRAFAEHLYTSCTSTFAAEKKPPSPPPIVIVNGFAPGLTLPDVLTTVTSALLPSHARPATTAPAALLACALAALDDSPSSPSSSSDSSPEQQQQQQPGLYLLINSLDAPALRRPAAQAALARLAAHPRARALVTVDSPLAARLWDAGARARWRCVAHDATTFAPLAAGEEGEGAGGGATAEIVDPVEAVGDLLGRRRGRRVGGRDGVAYVLRSLPERARGLFRLLVAEQVALSTAAAAESLVPLGKDGGGDGTLGKRPAAAPVVVGQRQEGVEYRVLYRRAREELVCSTEQQLRALLREFHDHQMVESERDALGAERLVVPFRREELEMLLEELGE